jgi:hypothetical protein
MDNTLRKLIDYLQTKHREKTGKNLLKTQLVKLAYLVEVEYYRIKRERLTGAQWIFFHYGPYSHEFGNPEDTMQIGTSQKGRALKTISVSEEGSDMATYDGATRSIIDQVYRDWGCASLNRLLDHVYFQSEPMIQAQRRREVLEFETIPEVKEMKPLKIDSNKLAEIRKRLQKRVKELEEEAKRKGETRPTVLIKEEYFDSSNPDFSISGQATF